jgi:PDZ domain-containing secreted protein
VSDPVVAPTPSSPSSTTAGRRSATLVIAIVLAVALGALVVFLPVPYIELSPGVSCNTLANCPEAGATQNVLRIDPKVKTYPPTGKLYFTTVAVAGAPGESRLTLFDALRGWFDSSIAVVPKDLLYPASQSSEQVECDNVKSQESSQNSATTAALTNLGYKVPVETRVYVDGFSANSPARAAGINICDDITSVDGAPVTSRTQLQALIGRHAVGDTVSVGYLHDGTRRTASVKLTAASSSSRRPVIGIGPQEISISKPPFEVKFDVGGVGGPSAGLMYALAIIDELTPGDLTGGVVVAGTGEITDDGKVKPIGGVQQKMLSARNKAHASLFLVPTDNCTEAAHARPNGLRLATVGTLKDALNVLAALRHEPGGVIHDCAG